MSGTSELGLYGLAVMGANLALNFLDKGTSLAVLNRSPERTRDFAARHGPANPRLVAAYDETAFVAALARPRRILLMVKAGPPVDEALAGLLPLLEAGDMVVDGGNSHFRDTERRAALAAARGISFVGLGVSGGEEGARRGASLMFGGPEEAWARFRPLLEGVAARADSGEACVDRLGPGGSGHYAKMVHNAIEYADMELIAETYHLLKVQLRAGHDEMRMIFSDWNRGELSSYLVGVAADCLGLRDEDGEPLLEKVLDAAGQKGTGAWSALSALELGVPAGLFAEAVFSRFLSGRKDERTRASALLGGPKPGLTGERAALVEDFRRALLAATAIAYAQGFQLLRSASTEYGWGLDLRRVALVWRAGCIIRSPFLDRIAEAYAREPRLESILLDSHFKSLLDQNLPALRRVVARAVEQGIPVPAFASALSYYDGMRSAWLPANLIQAMRDRFGAHGYERVDRPRGEVFHSDWS